MPDRTPRQILDAVLRAMNESVPDVGYMDAMRLEPTAGIGDREEIHIDGWVYADEVEHSLAAILAEPTSE